jgi:2-succinyl-5-enolpyruvyl-6-hydroxy-3-cyclohexene-1-carboxylate synthase
LILQHIIDLAALCAAHGITNAIISPGSRSAAITLAFESHPDIRTHIIPDERSAAFIAMGMAQQQQRPVALICTSGSAALNYAPAIAEAYYQEIPLLVITADRPPEWIDQYDGQTINQAGLYGKHVLASYELPVDLSHHDANWHANRLINEALIKTLGKVWGPVHLNVPIREPFYPAPSETINFENDVRVINMAQTSEELSEVEMQRLAGIWNQAKERWIIIGQNTKDKELSRALDALAQSATIINEVTGNQHGIARVVTNQDVLLSSNTGKIESPDLVVTIGKSLISKNLKLFLRANRPEHHWQIKATDRMNDGLQSMSEMIDMNPARFLTKLNPFLEENRKHSSLDVLDDAFEKKKSSFFEGMPFGEFKAIRMCMAAIPSQSNLHLANSMSVRYANFIGTPKAEIEVYCNRGTSGIDGSNSTAVGACMASNKISILITGDLAFFYDRNAFWHHEDYSNLRILLLNNDGGGIFNMIPGPKAQANKEKLFLTPHGLNAKLSCEEFQMEYLSVRTEEEMTNSLSEFFAKSDRPKVLEVFSDIESNTEILSAFKQL